MWAHRPQHIALHTPLANHLKVSLMLQGVLMYCIAVCMCAVCACVVQKWLQVLAVGALALLPPHIALQGVMTFPAAFSSCRCWQHQTKWHAGTSL